MQSVTNKESSTTTNTALLHHGSYHDNALARSAGDSKHDAMHNSPVEEARGEQTSADDSVPKPSPPTLVTDEGCEGVKTSPADTDNKEHSSPSNSVGEFVNNERLESSHIIPGVEHVFFEDELAKMEEKSVIILAVDDGCHSELAFKFYKENVDRPGYYLHVVHHVDAWSHYKPVEGGPSANHCKEMAEKMKGTSDVVEEKYKKLMEENQVQGEYFVVHGKDAWHDIIQHQEKTNAMMIVMGTRGAGALTRTFRGSVSDSVVHHANVPVLVCCHPKD